MNYAKGSAVSRLMRHVTWTPEDCWLWTAGLDLYGYGSVRLAGVRARSAHRAVWEALVGPVPAGMQLDHLCRVRHCVSPAHLEVVTPQENSRRATALITSCPAGHPYDATNTYVDPRGKRGCRPCRTAAVGRYDSRKRAGAA